LERTVYYSVKRPWSPLPSDRAVLWLASTYAASGYRVRALDRSADTGQDCSLLLTNHRDNTPNSGAPVLRVGSDGDRRDMIRLAMGRIYGLSPLYQRNDRKAGRVLSSLLWPLRKLLSSRTAHPADELAMPEIQSTLSGRRVMLRINVDWDAGGMDILERWCERYGLRPTLAIAGTEIGGSEQRVRRFVEESGCDIASHSWSHHVVMSSHGHKRQRMEITANHDYLRQLTGQKVRGFVAPYIKYDRRTFELLQECGYQWFIRSWLLHPLPLAQSGLTDMGVNFSFSRGWQNRLLSRLAHSDITLQLHLRDLVRYEHLLEHNIRLLLQHGVRIVDCETFFRETTGGQ
jgi:peptidoglycan/xylan/chitin deacetylase (PgdA/CDA1 family)